MPKNKNGLVVGVAARCLGALLQPPSLRDHQAPEVAGAAAELLPFRQDGGPELVLVEVPGRLVQLLLQLVNHQRPHVLKGSDSGSLRASGWHEPANKTIFVIHCNVI